MIVLDTNVVSELMRGSPQQTVLAWFGAQSPSSLFVTTVTEAEILTGIALLPYGRRQRGLSEAAARVFTMLFAGRILVFDSDAANIYAEIFAQRHAAGRPISQADCQIAAIARSRNDFYFGYHWTSTGKIHISINLVISITILSVPMFLMLWWGYVGKLNLRRIVSPL